MPRLPEVTDRNALPEAHREVHDYLTKTRGAVRLPFSALLHSPDVTQRIAHVGTYVRFESVLPDKTRELAILTAARERDVAFEWAGHCRLARELGISEETIDTIAYRKPLDKLSPEEALPIRFAREIINDHKVSDATWQAVHAKFGDRGAIDLAAAVGYYAMLGCILNTLELKPAPDAPQLP
ncbi:MAG TPA: carboxymuconolactone decarboxylase family protein [Dehalococcoidia bacterium]|nr:carboxymuconolactone decarboxylase family protein [Dehalococcoidia bacterium]